MNIKVYICSFLSKKDKANIKDIICLGLNILSTIQPVKDSS